MPLSSVPPPVDFQSIAHSAGFRDLVAKRRAFITAALGFAVVWFGGFLLLTSYADAFMQTVVVPGLTLAYLLGLSQFVLVWALTAAYLRAARRVFDPLQAALVNDIPATTSAPRA